MEFLKEYVSKKLETGPERGNHSPKGPMGKLYILVPARRYHIITFGSVCLSVCLSVSLSLSLSLSIHVYKYDLFILILTTSPLPLIIARINGFKCQGHF